MTRGTLWAWIAFGTVVLAAVGIVTFSQLSVTGINGVSNVPGRMQGTSFRFRNDFETPDEVVRYYVGRDASGYVWHGLLNAEREAFTTWEFGPRNESFLVANDIEIQPSEIESDRASIVVHYKIQNMSDGNAVRSPLVPPEDHIVTFELELNDDQWRIVSPLPHEIVPVVLASSVPFLAIADRVPYDIANLDTALAEPRTSEPAVSTSLSKQADDTPAESPEQRMASARSQAISLATGEDGTLNFVRSRELFEEAVAGGDRFAQMWVAKNTFYGIGDFPKVPSRAERWASEVLELVNEYAAQDLPEAQYLMGFAYQSGLGVSVNYVEAMRYYLKAAESGYTSAMLNIGVLYQNGDGVAQDESEAIRWYRKAAEAGHTIAMMSLSAADLAHVVQDKVKGVQWLKKAAEAGHPEAMMSLSAAYLGGVGVVQDKVEGIQWLKKTADGGNTQAMMVLGEIYRLGGLAIGKDDAEAVRWFRKAANGDSTVLVNESMLRLGHIYYNGRGVPQDDVEAARWFTKASIAGNVDASQELASMYRAGRGVPKDEQEADRWGSKLGEAVLRRPADIFYYESPMKPVRQEAISLQTGEAGLVNYARSRELLEEAAAGGDSLADIWIARHLSIGDAGFIPDRDRAQRLALKRIEFVKDQAVAGLPEAEDLLGTAYMLALGVSKDMEFAFAWFRNSAEGEYPNGMYDLAFMYENGYGVAKDDRNAFLWYLRAAEAGVIGAMAKIGWVYQKGIGTTQNYKEALRWYQKAGATGNADAMTNLGFMYDNGLGVEQDLAAALSWYRKAAAAGSEEAQKELRNRGITDW